MNKFEKTYLDMIKRNIQRTYFNILIFEQRMTIGDVISESVLPSPFKLLNDILNVKTFKKYSKNDLLKLCDKDWKYFQNLKNVDEKFSLTIIKCDFNEFSKFIDFYIELQSEIFEFCDPKNYLNEFIWISDLIDESKYSLNDIRILLKHELGHVWISIFGYSDDNFFDGRTNTESENFLNPKIFNKRQMDVFVNMYKKNLKNLQNDFNYLFIKNDGDDASWELSTHTDEIIELLIEDYFEQENKFNSTSQYLNYLINKITSSYDLFGDLNILKHYKNKQTYNGFKNITLMLNIINRLFLILTFGNNKSIEYFKNECEKEFGKIR